jgi:glutamate-1-semialdehyde 2,1-aminomutase
MVEAKGTRKWDVDGNEFIDFTMGHGSLLMGHGYPTIVDAVEAQLSRGTHLGGCHPLEVELGERVQRLVPCADRVEFVVSGTEATALAIRIARALTGRNKIAKFQGHFHGWNDYAVQGMVEPFDLPVSSGIPTGVRESVVTLPLDLDAVRDLLRSDPDVAGVIMEPAGAHSGQVPLSQMFLMNLREITREHGVLLVFDEVVTGFRWAPGGAQEYHQVIPDLAAFAKILGGGFSSGAVAGRQEVMAVLEYGDDDWNRHRRMMHSGTFNVNPMAAAAGCAMLDLVADGEPQKRATETNQALIQGINQALRRQQVPGCVFGDMSVMNVYVGPNNTCDKVSTCDGRHCTFDSDLLLKGMGKFRPKLHRSLLLHGFDILGGDRGWISAVHSEKDIEEGVAAFEAAIVDLKESGEL